MVNLAECVAHLTHFFLFCLLVWSLLKEEKEEEKEKEKEGKEEKKRITTFNHY